MRCIEIFVRMEYMLLIMLININMRCIEIYASIETLKAVNGLTLT